MSPLGVLILAAYFATLAILSLYGIHRYHLLRLFRRTRANPPRPAFRLDPLPRVTVQLPIYNELHVVERLIRAACRLDYPADRLEIQVLDDSDDGTSERAARLVAEMRARGHDVTHVRRHNRRGYKAGALSHGLERARGELIAVFDADFLPPPSFLRRMVDHFSHPRVGMVQARWGHLNRDYSALTRVQSILLDGHFVIEHAARHRGGRFFNFNGTAGVWRRTCIESAGGWQSDTLTEDLDLSYRAQLKGWQFVFLPTVVAPAELPADLDAFKSQQHRWARGSIETARKVLPRLLRARLPVAVKIEGAIHLTNNFAYLLIVLLSLLLVPAIALRRATGAALMLVDAPLFLLSTLSVWRFYLASQRETGERPWSALRRLPLLTSVGIGLCVTNGRAVLGAFSRRRIEFARTPKHDLRGRSGLWRTSIYRGRRHTIGTVVELGLGTYFAAATVAAMTGGYYTSLPFLLFFLSGYLTSSMTSLGLVFGFIRKFPTHISG